MVKCVMLLVLAAAGFAAAQPTRQIALADLRDKVRGAWAGKMIGVSFGAPTEFRHLGKIVPQDKLPAWTSEMVREALRQDDLYVQMTYAQVMDAKGLEVTTADFAAMFRDTQYPLWHTSLAARRALRRNVPFEKLATPQTSTHGQDISYQIIGDFVGLSCPAMPRTSNDLIDRASRLAAWGDGVCAGRFVAGMYTAAYFETDPRKIIEAGLACVPAESNYAHAIRDVLQWHDENRDDWQKTWRQLNEKWDNRDRCPYGALAPLDIDANLNGGYTAIGLLYGGGDFAKVMEVSTRCGQDSDCNPCTACGVWGAAHGYARIPWQYTDGIAAIANEKFIYTESSFNGAVENTIKRVITIAQANGGRVETDVLIVAPQAAEAKPVRDFPNPGKPTERISCDDSRWEWSGNWKTVTTTKSGNERVASEKGAEASITFTGTGAIICGPYVGTGGTADVYLDGKLDRTIDVYPDADRRVAMEDVWHRFGLSDGEHTIRMVVKGERFADSRGSEIRIHDLITYR